MPWKDLSVVSIREEFVLSLPRTPSPKANRLQRTFRNDETSRNNDYRDNKKCHPCLQCPPGSPEIARDSPPNMVRRNGTCIAQDSRLEAARVSRLSPWHGYRRTAKVCWFIATQTSPLHTQCPTRSAVKR